MGFFFDRSFDAVPQRYLAWMGLIPFVSARKKIEIILFVIIFLNLLFCLMIAHLFYGITSQIFY